LSISSSHDKEEIRKGIQDLITRITIEDGIAGIEIYKLYSDICQNQRLDLIKDSLSYKITVSDILGLNIVSRRRRFAGKRRCFHFFTEYPNEEE
jgi:hypothetical protein